MTDDSTQRLRMPPHERFAEPAHKYDVNEEFDQLESEGSTPVSGHRQIALYRHGPMTFALFSFVQGGELPDHAAEGTVSIHCVGGVVEVHAMKTTYTLSEGQMVVLAPDVVHDIIAVEQSRVLMTICLERE